jgi:hypothetical protein
MDWGIDRSVAGRLKKIAWKEKLQGLLRLYGNQTKKLPGSLSI